MPDYALMNQYLYEGNANEVERLTKEALAEGRPVQEVLNDGLIAGMSVVGEDFKHNVLYVPEVLISARAMKAGMAVLKPLLTSKDGGARPKGVLLMGTVRGDLHDIGKNLVGMMAEGAGFELHDIGVDQSLEKFMAAAEKCKPDIIGMSALLTTTMMYMKTVIEGFDAAGLSHIKMAIGGAPISQMFADEIGADGYGANASAAVDLFLRLASQSTGNGAHSAAQDGALGAAVNGSAGAPRNGVESGVTLVAPNVAGGGNRRLTTYKILYWQEIPTQIKAEDDSNDVTVMLDGKFLAHIDILAAKRGLQSSDDYLAQWKWSEEQEREGSAQEVAEALKAELEAKGF
jgi:methanogenic corrinoid protein MtbC1